MIAVKADILSFFKKPIQQKWFGSNKTWRGFVVMPLATWPGVVLAQYLESLSDLGTPLLLGTSSLLLAVLLGFGYCLAELPNSFIKRRLGVKEGQTADQYKWFFVILDQADSAFGCLFAYRLVINFNWQIFWMTIIFGTVIHLLINMSLYFVGIRKNPF